MNKKTLGVAIGILAVGVLMFVLKSRPAGPRSSTVSSTQTATPVIALENYVASHANDSAVPLIQSVIAALKANSAMQNTFVGEAAARTVQDGAITSEESNLLQDVIGLAEQRDIAMPVLQGFAAKYPQLIQSPSASGSLPPVLVTPQAAEENTTVTKAAAVIDRYIAKNPKGHGVAKLQRLTQAAKTRPMQSHSLVETVARRLEDGSLSKQDVTALEEAVELAEKEGLSPQEMAEFSKKYAMGFGLSEKPVSAPLQTKKEVASLPSFEGKRQLVYTFTGTAQCAQTPCTNIRVSVRVTSGKWVETRSETADAQGHYSLQLPILSLVNEKVLWALEAYSKDLRKATLQGERVTTSADKEITLQNNLTLNPA